MVTRQTQWHHQEAHPKLEVWLCTIHGLDFKGGKWKSSYPQTHSHHINITSFSAQHQNKAASDLLFTAVESLNSSHPNLYLV